MEKSQRRQHAINLFPDDSFDHAVLVDVLHHTADPVAVLAEARGGTTGSIVLKDDFAEPSRARFTLGVMDWVGNHQSGVGPHAPYRSRAQWDDVFAAAELTIDHLSTSVDLCPTPVEPVFVNGLDFVARLVECSSQ